MWRQQEPSTHAEHSGYWEDGYVSQGQGWSDKLVISTRRVWLSPFDSSDLSSLQRMERFYIPYSSWNFLNCSTQFSFHLSGIILCPVTLSEDCLSNSSREWATDSLSYLLFPPSSFFFFFAFNVFFCSKKKDDKGKYNNDILMKPQNFCFGSFFYIS